MNFHDYTFVALDLEATGLDTKNDTIIEVAAVRFHLIREGDIFRAVDREECSMLVNPGKKLEENIAIITGISDKMLEGKQGWQDIREKVREFIGDSIIVGHNVLFDIAMLDSHGIDLSGHIALDTFELSEIFSQDAESLNLGFLGKKYHIPLESEHRALDDTKLSIELFCRYLREVALLVGRKLNLWQHARTRDTSDIFGTLLMITGHPETSEDTYTLNRSELSTKNLIPSEKKKKRKTIHYNLMNLDGERERESRLIQDALLRKEPIVILTPNKKQSEYLSQFYTHDGYSTGVYKDISHFCSLTMLDFWLTMDSWSRKEAIFVVKLAYWLEDTKTGLLDDLKYYGDERDLLDLFRAKNNEHNPFFEAYSVLLASRNITLCDISAVGLGERALRNVDHTLIVRDIMSIEDVIRRKQSRHISFEYIFLICEKLGHLGTPDVWESIVTNISFLSEIYASAPERPTGKDLFPPGDFGETYFITQESLWHRGNKWLMLITRELKRDAHSLASFSIGNPIEHHYMTYLLQDISLLGDISSRKTEDIGIIISIIQEKIKVSFIPRDVRGEIDSILNTQAGNTNILIGYGIAGTESEKFLREECGIVSDSFMDIEKKYPPIEYREGYKIRAQKSVILTTSMKHARTLSQELRQKNDIQNIWAQGLSGGKGKMMTLFRNAKEKSLLIGMIDSFIDESELWETVDEVIIAKIPFDPPTDPYFLARTVGMKNNFEEYSTPLAIATINTLIGHIRFAHPKICIFCSDERLENMSWGKNMKIKLI